MAKKRKSWLNDSRASGSDAQSYSEPPPAEGDRAGVWAKSEVPPAFDEGSGDSRSSYGFDRVAKRTPPGSESSGKPPAFGFLGGAKADRLSGVPSKPAPAPALGENGAAPEPLAKAEEAPRPAAAAEPGERTTTIGKTIVIRGKLVSDENLIVRGRIEAEIRSSKDLNLEETGIINADMRLKSVTISGIVVGDIYAQERVKLAPEARVVGDIYTPRLVVEDGASFRGRVEMEGLEHLEGVRPRFQEETGEAGASSGVASGDVQASAGDGSGSESSAHRSDAATGSADTDSPVVEVSEIAVDSGADQY